MTEEDKLGTGKDPAVTKFSSLKLKRAGVKALPYIGSALDELFFGHLNDIRWARLEKTLAELDQMMRERKIPPNSISNEDFASLLENVGPSAGITTSERKRCFLRDLLLNTTGFCHGDAEWESARFAADLIEKLDAPALEILEILAALQKLGIRGSVKANLKKKGDIGCIEVTETNDSTVTLNYHWLVLEQAYRSLSANQPRLVIAGSHGRDTYEKIALTEVGDFLINWCTADPVVEVGK